MALSLLDNRKKKIKMKDFEILPATKEEWFDKYQALLEEIDKKEDELVHLKKLNKKYFDLAEKFTRH